MPKLLTASARNFSAALGAALSPSVPEGRKLADTVRGILARVEKEGDKALLALTKQFDRMAYKKASDLKVRPAEVAAAIRQVSPERIAALEMAAQRIEDYHRRQLPKNSDYKDNEGNLLGWRWHAVESAGLYVPGGAAVYPSSVLMNAIPAKVAGVSRIAMAVPAPQGRLSPLVLAAADICGIKEIYKVGGAQAIGAFCFGTALIGKVDMIVGPGNRYVAEAKRQVFGRVGIDMIAGPSEILVIADSSARPEWIAADLLSQAEHDADARAILVTDSKALAQQVKKAVTTMLKTLNRRDIAAKSWEKNGLVVLVEDMSAAAEVANRIAPEHLELMIRDPQALLPYIRNAGAVFLGAYTPEAIGDYTAGPSHVLPTSGSARFSSGLSVFTFLRRSSLIGCSEKGFGTLAEATERLAVAEGLTAHAASVTLRRDVVLRPARKK